MLSVIIPIFPLSTGFSSDVHDAFVFFGSKATILDPIFPFATMGSVIGLVIGVELLIFGFKGIKWIISHIPWIGGRG